MIFADFYLDYAARIGAAMLCGLILGLERKVRQHTVGMRTLVLISISSALLTIISVVITRQPAPAGGDPTRIASGIVTGIGFLGGGAILRQGLNIRGLTSAAIIWTAAAIGSACGCGQFFLAGITLALSVVSLLALGRLEFIYFPAEKTKYLTLIYSGINTDIDRIRHDIAAAGLMQRDINMSTYIEKNRTVIRFSVKAPGDFNLDSLMQKLMRAGTLLRISISDD